MTKYRTVSNGHWEYLEYLSFKKGFLGTKEIWKKIPCPYYHWLKGRSDDHSLKEDYLYINSLRHDLRDFVAKYTSIESYWPIYMAEQLVVETRARAKLSAYNERNGVIKYL